MKRTKIVATIGPACDDKRIMAHLIASGVNVARLNFSHGTHEEQQKRIDMIKEVREKVDTNASFISFLCTIAKNLLMNMYQRQTVEYVYNEYLLKSSVDRDSQTEENIDLHFLNDYIDSLAEELPAQRKKIFILSKRQNYTNKEIAEMMGISESTVATQLSLAVKFMREQLMKHYDKVIALLIAFFVNEM